MFFCPSGLLESYIASIAILNCIDSFVDFHLEGQNFTTFYTAQEFFEAKRFSLLLFAIPQESTITKNISLEFLKKCCSDHTKYFSKGNTYAGVDTLI